jgi:hypothetical protein
MAGIVGRAVNICADLDENEHRKGRRHFENGGRWLHDHH